jgi:hypothetical protein
MVRGRPSTLWLSLVLASSGCDGCDDSEAALRAESERLWGREKLAAAIAERAEARIDARALADDVELWERVRTMGFRELVARLGFVVYSGQARFVLERNEQRVEVYEDTTIEHALHGGWRVLQKDEEGVVLREKVFSNGLYYVRSGPGALRAQGVADAPGGVTLDEAFSPLASFTAWYGPRLGIAPAGTAVAGDRVAVRYRLGLAAGPELVEDPTRPGKRLRPLRLDGELLVDAETAAPVGGRIRGALEIEPPPKGTAWGRLELALDFEVKPREATPIEVGEHVPPIAHRDVDLDPLGFLEGETLTSTVIRGTGRETQTDAAR